MSLWTVIIYFVIYIVIHSIIGVQYKKIQQKMIDNPNDQLIRKQEKNLERFFKWFPGLYVIFLLIIFYVF